MMLRVLVNSSAIVGMFLLNMAAFAQTGGDYDLTWSTVDGGGEVSTGGEYELAGSIGQADAGTLSGGDYALDGGFWPATVPGGCGPCRLYMDFEPFFCVVDIGDVTSVLNAFSEADTCSTITSVGATPGAQVFNGSCPLACVSAADCVTQLGPGECVAGQCCDLCDVAEVTAVLDMFSDNLTPNCAQRCAPGACELGPPANCCRDNAHLDLSMPVNPDQGTSWSDCAALGGAFLGENVTCAASALPRCPDQ